MWSKRLIVRVFDRVVAVIAADVDGYLPNPTPEPTAFVAVRQGIFRYFEFFLVVSESNY